MLIDYIDVNKFLVLVHHIFTVNPPKNNLIFIIQNDIVFGWLTLRFQRGVFMVRHSAVLGHF